MWGRRILPRFHCHIDRNTPTGVGKTNRSLVGVILLQKHPHGCGEDATPFPRRNRTGETPPRVWGRQTTTFKCILSARNTPTGVGKTIAIRADESLNRKHPHGCGEDEGRPDDTERPLETPPRVWGRLTVRRVFFARMRNTPTGVGKTLAVRWGNRPGWKHPHGCGEDLQQPQTECS